MDSPLWNTPNVPLILKYLQSSKWTGFARPARERIAVLAPLLTPSFRSISRQETLEVHSWEMGCVLKGSCYREVRSVTDFRTLLRLASHDILLLPRVEDGTRSMLADRKKFRSDRQSPVGPIRMGCTRYMWSRANHTH
jgi:hypothetical protein